MRINFERYFSLELELNENELRDLLSELEHISETEPSIDQLLKLYKEIQKSIEHNKGFTMVETE